MKLDFVYDEQKDVENFLRATRAKNNSNYTKLAQEYVGIYGEDFEPERSKAFLREYREKHAPDERAVGNY